MPFRGPPPVGGKKAGILVSGLYGSRNGCGGLQCTEGARPSIRGLGESLNLPSPIGLRASELLGRLTALFVQFSLPRHGVAAEKALVQLT